MICEILQDFCAIGHVIQFSVNGQCFSHLQHALKWFDCYGQRFLISSDGLNICEFDCLRSLFQVLFAWGSDSLNCDFIWSQQFHLIVLGLAFQVLYVGVQNFQFILFDPRCL